MSQADTSELPSTRSVHHLMSNLGTTPLPFTLSIDTDPIRASATLQIVGADPLGAHITISMFDEDPLEIAGFLIKTAEQIESLMRHIWAADFIDEAQTHHLIPGSYHVEYTQELFPDTPEDSTNE